MCQVPGEGKGCLGESRVTSQHPLPHRPFPVPRPPRSAPETSPLRLSADGSSRMNEYSLLARWPKQK